MNYPLNHGWSFSKGKPAEAQSALLKNAETIEIPHCVDMYPAQYISERAYQGDYTYQLRFDCKDDSPSKTLVFHGVMLQFDCYLNGTHLGHFISGYLPVYIDVSEHIRPKNNLLCVYVDGREDHEIPPFGKVVDYLTFAGIYREVELLCRPKAHIEDVFVQASLNGKVNLSYALSEEGEVRVEVHDGETLVHEGKDKDFKIPNVHPWSIEDPHLYDFDFYLGQEHVHKRIGFRDIRFGVDGFFLNGKRVPLIGLNRHQTYPYFGPAAPKSLQQDDADLLKSGGINVVRTSHYPQSEHFLDRCDEIGLLVLDEIPGWQYIGKDKNWRRNCCDFARRMILKERNHASLIAYGLRIDESGDDDELYGKIQAIKAELDPKRPSIGVRNFKDSHCLEQIYGYNDFSNDSLEHGVEPAKQIKGAEGKPILITETNGHMFPTKTFDPTDRRLEQALRHAKTLSDALSDNRYCGELSWCAFDYNTHKDFGSGDHICHHGVYDIYRNPKYAAAFYKSQGEAPFLEVASLVQPGDANEALMPKIYCFTNADYVELYKGDAHIGKFLPDKASYPGVPHPPIVVDDIIGETFHEKGISEKDGKKIVEAFNYCSQNGFSRLRLSHKLTLARFMAKYHMKFSDVYATYAKYIQSWGEGSVLWRFLAYKDGKKVAEVRRGPSTEFHLEAIASKDTLVHGDTFDCLRIQVLKKDQYGTTLPYASDPIQIETEGPIEVYGPNIVSLYGGGTAVYIRSKATKAPKESVVTIKGISDSVEVRLLVLPQ